jgi:transcription elongation GreA/GreB family factor
MKLIFRAMQKGLEQAGLDEHDDARQRRPPRVKNSRGRHYPPNPLRVNKSAIRSAILAQLRRELSLQAGAAQLARDEAISEESRAESKYDTHGQEAAYLAEGQAKLAGEIEANLALYAAVPLPDFEPDGLIALGALVELGTRGKSAWYFLGPKAGGIELHLDGRDILVLTPQSPLGRQFLGQRVGDTVQIPGRGGAATGHKILSVT